MIKGENGHVIVRGEHGTVMADTIEILATVIEVLREKFGEEGANEFMAFLGRAAVETSDNKGSEESARRIGIEMAELTAKWLSKGLTSGLK